MNQDADLSYNFLKQLTKLPFIERIYIFGSRARKTATETSDIDLAIQCPSATEKDWLHIMQIIQTADTLLKIDCIRLDKLSDGKLKQNILEEKKLLYEKSNHD